MDESQLSNILSSIDEIEKKLTSYAQWIFTFSQSESSDTDAQMTTHKTKRSLVMINWWFSEWLPS